MVVIAYPRLRSQSAFKLAGSHRRNRFPHHVVRWVPEGFALCRRCTSLIDLHERSDGYWRCPNGHAYDFEAEERECADLAGPPPHSGLSPTDMGRLGEWIVSTHVRDFGCKNGKIVGEDKPYHGALDFVTTAGGGIEVKTVDADAECKAYNLAQRSYRQKKDAALAELHLDFALMVLVVVDLRTSTAQIHVRRESRFMYWRLKPDREPYRVVSFELPPWAEAVIGGADRAMELLSVSSSVDDDMPF